MAVDVARLTAVLNMTALATIMLSMGLRVGFAEVMASARPARRLVLGLLANYVLVPAVTLGLLAAFRPDPMVAAGFLILAACPGAPVGPPITALARGGVSYSVSMMLILAGLSALLSPVLLGVLLDRISPERDLHVDYPTIVRTLLITQLLPLAFGLGIHQRAPRLTRAIAGPTGLLGNVLLLALVVLIVATQHGTLAAIRSRGWLGIGWCCGAPDVAIRKALATTTATRNVAVALVIATSSFAGTPAVTAVVAYGLVSIVGALGFALLFGRFTAVEPDHVPAGS
jgi:BASS family bile acid:Na+ symporter